MCFELHDEDTAGERPPCLGGPPGVVDKLQQRNVEPVVETFVPVPILDVPVPQMVDHLVDVLKVIERTVLVVAEKVIEVPKIFSQDRIPQRTVLCGPQLAKQLVEV